MFLFHTLFVFIAIYVSSALLAETIFTSKIEKKLPTAVRVGLGYFLSLFYFVSSWLFLSIRQAWIFGLILLGLYVYGKVSKGLFVLDRNKLKYLLTKHIKTLSVFLLSANLFFLPLHFAGHYGPFTEGGGDVSVYSDAAKRLTDFNLNAVGLEESASLKERLRGIKELMNKDYSDWYKAQGADFINPPNANYQINKIAFNLQLNTIQYTPCAQFAFLSKETNYPIFYALLAFLYSLILISVWGFFRPFGLIPAIISFLIISGSNALVSAFYNMYLLQVLSMTFLALTLTAVPFISLFSIAGLRVYGFGSTFILMSYPHFLPIILPLLFLASISNFYKEEIKSEKPKSNNRTNIFYDLFHHSPSVILSLLFISEIYVGYKSAIHLATGLMSGIWTNETNLFVGKSVLEFSEQWWTFIFGLASQQHFLPLMTENDTMNLLFMLGTRLGFLLLATSLVLIILCRSRNTSSQKNKEIWHHIGIYLTLAITICIYSMVTQSSLYTQAKGAQYFLLCLYFVMLLPLAIVHKGFGPIKLQNPFGNNKKGDKIIFTTTFYILILFVFSSFLWVPRAIYAYRIGHHKDRSTVMEPSFFAEAKRIKAEDNNAFVIFEPRTSSDVYFPFQAFAGYRLVPTRHLILEQFFLGNSPDESHRVSKIPSDFVTPDDIPYLWSMTATKEKEGKYLWKAERFFRNKSPYIYFTGYDYQRNSISRPRINLTTLQDDTKDWGIFTRIRNGSAMIYLPPGGPYNLEIQVLSRHEKCTKEFKKIPKDTNKKNETEETPSINNRSTKSYIITRFLSFKASPSPRLELVSKCGQDHWFNARLNGKEMGTLIN